MEECRECHLWETARHQVDGDGPVPCDWMVIGEAPGREEDASGVPFVGAAGRELDRLLELAGLTRGEVYVTNVVRHRPPGNRKPTVSEVRICGRKLAEELRAVRPKCAILLGATPLGLFLPKDSISSVHGRVRRDGEGMYIIPMYHPAAMLHNPSLRGVMEEDWRRMRKAVAAYGRNNRDYGVMVADHASADVVSIDTETDWSGKIVGASYSSSHGYARYVPAIGDVAPPLTVEAATLVMHHAKFDLKTTREMDVRYDRLADTMIAGYLLNEESLGLKNLALRRLGEDMDYLGPMVARAQQRMTAAWMERAGAVELEKKWRKSYSEASRDADPTAAFLRRKALRGRLEEAVGPFPIASPADIPLEEIGPYGCADADMTRRLWFDMSKELEQRGLAALFWKLEMPLLPVLMKMEERGIAVDEKVLEGIQNDLGRLLQESLDGCKAFGDFNPNSPQAALEVLRRTGVRVRDTNKVTLTPHKNVPVVAALLHAREVRKLQGYVRELREDVREDGRIHTTYNQVKARDDEDAEGATRTGRLSCSQPNLQQIPVRTELGARIRLAFVASPGKVLVSADYSQIEPRVLAHICQDAGLLYAFRTGRDPYKYVASLMYGVEEDGVTKEQRTVAKPILLGTNYGLSAEGYALRNDVPLEVAEERLKLYLDKFPGVRQYMVDVVEEGRKKGYVSTLWGRREYLPELMAADDRLYQQARRQALNMPIQGTAADIMKAAMLVTERELERLPDTQLLLQVHDELIAETPTAQADACQRAMAEAMLSVIRLSVPLVVHTRVGASWGALGEERDWKQEGMKIA